MNIREATMDDFEGIIWVERRCPDKRRPVEILDDLEDENANLVVEDDGKIVGFLMTNGDINFGPDDVYITKRYVLPEYDDPEVIRELYDRADANMVHMKESWERDCDIITEIGWEHIATNGGYPNGDSALLFRRNRKV